MEVMKESLFILKISKFALSPKFVSDSISFVNRHTREISALAKATYTVLLCEVQFRWNLHTFYSNLHTFRFNAPERF